MNYINEPLIKFIEDAACRTATPGGGSVSALIGALGTTMISMSANFTIGKEKFKDVEIVVKGILDKCEKYRKELLNLMEKDIQSYDNVIRAYRLPISSDSEKKEKTKAIQKALKNAIEVPLKVSRCCINILENVRQLVDIGNPNLISDMGVAALATKASFSGAKLNVSINLTGIENNKFVEKMVNEIDEAETKAEILFNETMEIVNSKIGNNLNFAGISNGMEYK